MKANPLGNSLVGYHVLAGDVVPELTSPAGYDYLLAGNGLFKRAENAHLTVVLPLWSGRMPYLGPVEPSFVLRGGKIPGWILSEIVSASEKRALENGQEAMFFVVRDENGGYRWVRPEIERAHAGSVRYQRTRQEDVVLEIHSHHEMRAFFSDTDDQDELGFRIYGVLGRLLSSPEIRLRVGVHGDRWELGVNEVFEEDIGCIRDATEEAVDRELEAEGYVSTVDPEPWPRLAHAVRLLGGTRLWKLIG